MATTTLQAPSGHDQSEVEAKAAAAVKKVSGTTEARIAELDAKSARRLRERQAEVALKREETALTLERAEAKRAAKAARKAASATRRQANRQARLSRFNAAVARINVFIAGNARSRWRGWRHWARRGSGCGPPPARG
jgi:hypothetical protein